MLDKEDLKLLSDLLDEKFAANNAVLHNEFRVEIKEATDSLRNELRAEIRESADSLRNELRAEIRESADSLRNELRAEIKESADSIRNELRAEIRESADSLRNELRTEIRETANQLRTEIKDATDSLRDELRSEIQDSKDELHTVIALNVAQLRGEIAKGDAMLKEQMELGFANMDARLAHIEYDVSQLKDDVRDIRRIIDKEIRPQLELLSEILAPEVKRFKAAADETVAIKKDIRVLNLTVAKHSELLTEAAAT